MTSSQDSPFAAETALRLRLAADLRPALRSRDTAEIAAIRSLIAAIDNAGAVAHDGLNAPVVGRSGDVPRQILSAGDLEAIVAGEIAEREVAAVSYEQAGRVDAAERLRQELRVIGRYRSPR